MDGCTDACEEEKIQARRRTTLSLDPSPLGHALLGGSLPRPGSGSGILARFLAPAPSLLARQSAPGAHRPASRRSPWASANEEAGEDRRRTTYFHTAWSFARAPRAAGDLHQAAFVTNLTTFIAARPLRRRGATLGLGRLGRRGHRPTGLQPPAGADDRPYSCEGPPARSPESLASGGGAIVECGAAPWAHSPKSEAGSPSWSPSPSFMEENRAGHMIITLIEIDLYYDYYIGAREGRDSINPRCPKNSRVGRWQEVVVCCGAW